MSPHESLVTETREWLARAQADLDACAALIQVELPAEALFERLSQYAWRFRYPGAPYSPGRTEADDARQAARRLLEAVTGQLKSQFAG